jgi:hypothetical protein
MVKKQPAPLVRFSKFTLKKETTMVKKIILMLVGIALAAGGIMWNHASNPEELVIQKSFTIDEWRVIKLPAREYVLFPAFMGVAAGIVWIIGGIRYDEYDNFFAAICRNIGITLITLSIMKFIRGLGTSLLNYVKNAQFPSAFLQYVFVYHQKTSSLIAFVVGYLFFLAGRTMDE